MPVTLGPAPPEDLPTAAGAPAELSVPWFVLPGSPLLPVDVFPAVCAGAPGLAEGMLGAPDGLPDGTDGELEDGVDGKLEDWPPAGGLGNALGKELEELGAGLGMLGDELPLLLAQPARRTPSAAKRTKTKIGRIFDWINCVDQLRRATALVAAGSPRKKVRS